MDEEFQFGPYVLRTGKRAVLLNGQPIPLGSRAMDILIYLVRNAGELQTNAAIIKNSWPDTYVDEANLRVHISALRRALGDTKREPQYIANIPGRGYAFIGPLSIHVPEPPQAYALGMEKLLPPPRLVGRDEIVASLVDRLSSTRLLTIAGPGGVGKSATARAVAERFGQPVVWIDLSQLGQAEPLAKLVAARLDVAAAGKDLHDAICLSANERSLLLVLDGCEHVIADAADFAERAVLMPGAARILATSREPLRIRGEHVHRLAPLDMPALAAPHQGAMPESPMPQTPVPETSISAEQALKASAVRLFVERADACLGGYRLTDQDASAVVEICERLDGIPLAIELATSRLETIGVEALALSLRQNFQVLSRGTRTAPPRHRSLHALLDWSYELLSEAEKQTLQHLSILRGWFTMDMATHLAATADFEATIEDLVSKSLLAADPAGRRTRFRMLETTRHYAATKLMESGRRADLLRAAAQSLAETLGPHEAEMLSRPLEDWSQDYAQHLPTIRLAADWAFGEDADPPLGVRLIVSALPLFFRLTLMEESSQWASRAVSALNAGDGDATSLMKLHAALGWPAMRSILHPDKGVAAWTVVLALAQSLDDVDFQLRAIWALWVDAITSAEPRTALEIAGRFAALADRSGDPMDRLVALRMKATALHWLGRHVEARELLLLMLSELDAVPARTASGRYHLDQGITARIALARCHWVLGDADLAFGEIERAVNDALAIKHEVCLTHVLAEAGCPLALLDGRLDLAREYAAMLKTHTETLSLDLWQTYARCFEAEIDIAEGRTEDGLRDLRADLSELEPAGFRNFLSGFALAEARGLAQLGRLTEALARLDATLESCRRSGESWCVPELLRTKAGLLLAASPAEQASDLRQRRSLAQVCLHDALESARTAKACGWERRILRDLQAVSGLDHDFDDVSIVDAGELDRNVSVH